MDMRTKEEKEKDLKQGEIDEEIITNYLIENGIDARHHRVGVNNWTALKDLRYGDITSVLGFLDPKHNWIGEKSILNFNPKTHDNFFYILINRKDISKSIVVRHSVILSYYKSVKQHSALGTMPKTGCLGINFRNVPLRNATTLSKWVQKYKENKIETSNH